MPSAHDFLSFQKIVIIMPKRIAKTGPPITGINFPKKKHGIAIHRQTRIPNPFFLKKFIFVSCLDFSF